MIVRDRQRETMKERGVLKRPSTRMDGGHWQCGQNVAGQEEQADHRRADHSTLAPTRHQSHRSFIQHKRRRDKSRLAIGETRLVGEWSAIWGEGDR